MASILKVDTIQDQSGNNIINESADTITIGASGDTITVPTGASLTVPSGGLTGQNYPAFGATATHTLTTSTVEKISFDTEIYDTDNAFDSTTNYRFTVPTGADGKYIIYANLMTGAAVDDGEKLETRIYKNGVSFIEGQYFSPAANKAITASVSATLDLVATDYIEIYGFQDSGTNSTLTNTMFYGYRIGA